MMSLRKMADAAIIVLILANCLGIAFFFVLRHRAGLYGDKDHIPVPTGYLLNESYLSAAHSACFLIRLASDGCPYCRADQHYFSQLSARARLEGCTTVTIAPQKGQMKLNEGGSSDPQLQYVDMKLGRALVPYTVPQTLLLDRNGQISWYQVGSMDEQAFIGALNIFSKIRGR